MSDVGDVREALTVLHRRLQEEGYGPEFGEPDPVEVFNAALAALDRLEEALGQHMAHTHSVSDRERRYETALRKIAEETWTLRSLEGRAIARRALGEA